MRHSVLLMWLWLRTACCAPAEVAAVLPLPSLADAAALCLRCYNASVEGATMLVPHRSRWSACCGLFLPAITTLSHWPRITAIVHVPHTLSYHARVVQDTSYALEHRVSYHAFTARYDTDERVWKVDWRGFDRRVDGGWRAVNVDDNVEAVLHYANGQFSAHSRALLVHPPAQCATGSASSTNKQRYIELLRCSEHEHNRCYHLLPPSPPLHTIVGPLRPLPVCCSCRTLLARCIQLTHFDDHLVVRVTPDVASCIVLGVTRVTSTLYETIVRRDNYHRRYAAHFRLSITHNGKSMSRDSIVRRMQQGESWERWRERVEVAGYEVVAQYGEGSWCYAAESNVCERCECGISVSGAGHSERCERIQPARCESGFAFH